MYRISSHHSGVRRDTSGGWVLIVLLVVATIIAFAVVTSDQSKTHSELTPTALVTAAP